MENTEEQLQTKLEDAIKRHVRPARSGQSGGRGMSRLNVLVVSLDASADLQTAALLRTLSDHVALLER